jgi:hypothetical protein
MSKFQFGRGGCCCWKPQGCTMTAAQGCRLMHHPIKRAMLADDRTAPCPKGWQPAGVPLSCALLNGHAGPCVEKTKAAA